MIRFQRQTLLQVGVTSAGKLKSLHLQMYNNGGYTPDATEAVNTSCIPYLSKQFLF